MKEVLKLVCSFRVSWKVRMAVCQVSMCLSTFPSSTLSQGLPDFLILLPKSLL